jgi:hypothetical protein
MVSIMEINSLVQYQMHFYTDKPKYKHPRVNFLIFDDLVGNNAAFKRGNSSLNNLIIKHRH